MHTHHLPEGGRNGKTLARPMQCNRGPSTITTFNRPTVLLLLLLLLVIVVLIVVVTVVVIIIVFCCNHCFVVAVSAIVAVVVMAIKVVALCFHRELFASKLGTLAVPLSSSMLWERKVLHAGQPMQHNSVSLRVLRIDFDVTFHLPKCSNKSSG